MEATANGEQWKSHPADYRIEPAQVHVWRSRFDATLLSNGRFAETLSKDESERAWRFVRQSDRERYVFSHGLLRKILGAYLGCQPQELEFKTNRYGKPFVTLPGPGSEIRFNLSHSRDMTLIAVAGGVEVGIDVEYMRTLKDARQIVNRFFSIHERRFLNSLPPEDFSKAFFDCWTSKEAFLKGIGQGLSYPLDGFTITFSHENPQASIFIDNAPHEAHGWHIVRLLPGPGYSGALATEAHNFDAAFFDF